MRESTNGEREREHLERERECSKREWALLKAQHRERDRAHEESGHYSRQRET